MPAERGRDDGGRELRLEGAGLIIVGGILLAAVGGAYYVGKWVERSSRPPVAAATAAQGALSQVVQPESVDDAERGQNFFDAPAGDQKELEPSREARPDPTPTLEADPPGTPGAAPAGSSDSAKPARPGDPGGEGDYFVQVFAGRDRSSAESLVGKLKNQGYVVKVFSEREGQGLLFKVRVGGYPSKDRAQNIAASLKESGYSAWVPPLE